MGHIVLDSEDYDDLKRTKPKIEVRHLNSNSFLEEYHIDLIWTAPKPCARLYLNLMARVQVSKSSSAVVRTS